MLVSIILTSALAAATLSPSLESWTADPVFGMRDAYKWIYQATMGGEHAAPSRAEAEQWLQQEWQQLGPSMGDERLIEPLGASGVVRLHLRPFRDGGGSPERLLDAFLGSAASFRPDRDAFIREWRALGQRLRLPRTGHLTHDAWVQLDVEMRRGGYPAVHHSDPFARTHRPAYRVLTAEQAEALAGAQSHQMVGPR